MASCHETTGVREPTFLVSPFVDPGAVLHTPLDHTAILAFLGERFDPGASYAPVVDARQHSLGRLVDALTRTEPRLDIPVPPALPAAVLPPALRAILPLTRPLALPPGATANAQAFDAAARELVRRDPLAALQLLPELAPFRELPLPREPMRTWGLLIHIADLCRGLCGNFPLAPCGLWFPSGPQTNQRNGWTNGRGKSLQRVHAPEEILPYPTRRWRPKPWGGTEAHLNSYQKNLSL